MLLGVVRRRWLADRGIFVCRQLHEAIPENEPYSIASSRRAIMVDLRSPGKIFSRRPLVSTRI
jgi:hypothetical protein